MSENQAQANAGCPQEKPVCFCLGAGPKLTEMLRKLGPESARRHFRNARVEVLKGMRELIDRRISDLTQPEEKGTKVAVE